MEKSSTLLESGFAEAVVLPIDAPDPVKNFLRRTGTEALLTTALRLVEQCFPRPYTIELEVSRDPEEGVE